MGFSEGKEGFNTSKSIMQDFFDDLEGRLTLLTKQVDYEQVGLTLEEVRKPMLVLGLPGIGKTCGIISIIKKFNKILPSDKQLGFKKILLGQTVVGSMSGIPIAMPDGRVVRVQMPDLPDPARDGEYGVLFLDEITTADEMQIQPALGLADDSRNIGEYSLPAHWLVVAAGNGVDCTNFVRLDDMTISRFTVYDINYNYKKDWRPYAHANNINSDIIAFLNFKPELCVRVESNDMDEAGKLFPCPRTWERLSTELRMRQALGKPVSDSEITNFAGRIIGIKAAREFGAFMAFKSKLIYSPEKIVEGTESDPTQMEKEAFHIILEACIKLLKPIVAEGKDENGDFDLRAYTAVGNFVTWILKMVDLESKINAIIELQTDISDIKDIVTSDDFDEICPSFLEFSSEHSALILQNIQNITSYQY
jgi:hypothetical protein